MSKGLTMRLARAVVCKHVYARERQVSENEEKELDKKDQSKKKTKLKIIW